MSSPADSTPAQKSWAFVRAILQMIASLELSAVADGVETGEQADALRQLECPYAQGYYFSPPLPAAEIAALIRPHAGAPHK